MKKKVEVMKEVYTHTNSHIENKTKEIEKNVDSIEPTLSE